VRGKDGRAFYDVDLHEELRTPCEQRFFRRCRAAPVVRRIEFSSNKIYIAKNSLSLSLSGNIYTVAYCYYAYGERLCKRRHKI